MTWKFIARIAPLAVLLVSCQGTNVDLPESWNTYRNPRFNFEFLYPNNWIPFPIPDNLDGRAFRDPENPNCEIRGWAEFAELGTPSPESTSQPLNPSQPQNFLTEQGETGKLQVDLDSDISLMTLTLTQDNVSYNWQGRCESEQFADYYRFFYYIARQYRLPVPDKNG
ncbi:hypothetical protein [Coleofasciculus sp.]|uniref:hypothetical protein n=1 Tax=Coleofasciculus sp. TaxID=3100458 RepID=UPI003A404C14